MTDAAKRRGLTAVQLVISKRRLKAASDVLTARAGSAVALHFSRNILTRVVNKELKRRANVVDIFPDDDAVLRPA